MEVNMDAVPSSRTTNPEEGPIMSVQKFPNLTPSRASSLSCLKRFEAEHVVKSVPDRDSVPSRRRGWWQDRRLLGTAGDQPEIAAAGAGE